MFTGLVEALGTVEDLLATGAGRRLRVRELALAGSLKLGESLAVNGACLTVERVQGRRIMRVRIEPAAEEPGEAEAPAADQEPA